MCIEKKRGKYPIKSGYFQDCHVVGYTGKMYNTIGSDNLMLSEPIVLILYFLTR